MAELMLVWEGIVSWTMWSTDTTGKSAGVVRTAKHRVFLTSLDELKILIGFTNPAIGSDLSWYPHAELGECDAQIVLETALREVARQPKTVPCNHEEEIASLTMEAQGAHERCAKLEERHEQYVKDQTQKMAALRKQLDARREVTTSVSQTVAVTETRTEQPAAEITLGDGAIEHEILHALGTERMSALRIAERFKLDLPPTKKLLLELEVRRLIQRQNNGQYQLIEKVNHDGEG